MKTLSYSTMNTLLECPHTWLCKQMGLKTFDTDSFKDGRIAHNIIQSHVCGVEKNPLLLNLPTFSMVEEVDFDEKMKIEYQYDDDTKIIGFVDGKDPERKDFLEIKSGRIWSMADFARLPQWKIYSLALSDYKKVWFVNVPKDKNRWNSVTVRVFNANITEHHKMQAKEFIKAALDVIANIDTYMDGVQKAPRNRYCFYEGCPWCID
jgi:hypothetical protein